MTRRFDRIKRDLARAADRHAAAQGGPMSPEQRATAYVRAYAVEAGYSGPDVDKVVAAWLSLDATDRIDSLNRMAGQYKKRGKAKALHDAETARSRKIMNPVVTPEQLRDQLDDEAAQDYVGRAEVADLLHGQAPDDDDLGDHPLSPDVLLREGADYRAELEKELGVKVLQPRPINPDDWEDDNGDAR